ncbi:MAG: acyltransferase [Sphingomonadaceae bacterium]|nr:acyltransferase [Sphingomonadaceae bacterium]
MSLPIAKPTAPSSRLPLLDGLRGLAAIGVMLYHVGNIFGGYGPFSRSYLFVDFFFLLSGFVLALAAEKKMNAGWGTMGFMRARVIRLWPMIAVGAVIGAIQVGSAFGWAHVPFLLLLALLMVPAMHGPAEIFPLNGPQWSLMLEVIANLLHAVVLRRLSQSSLLAFVIASGLALAAVIFHFGSNTLGPFAHNWWFALPRVAFAYSLGVWLARYWQSRQHRELTSWSFSLALPVLCLMILPGLPISIAIGDAVIVLFGLPAMFWLAATSRVPERAAPFLDRLGAISFPLYAVHLPIVHFYARLGQSWSLMVSAVASTLLASMVLAIVMDKKSSDKRSKPPKTMPQPLARKLT